MTAARHDPAPPNTAIADRFDEVASLLEQQDADTFRVRAWRNAATTIRALPRPVAVLFEEEGLEGLERLPTIGRTLARAIAQLVRTGRLGMLDRLRGATDPVTVLASVPGIGKRLAQRLHDELHIESLEALELAAHDGSLARLPGFGTKRVRGIRAALAARLGRVRHAAAEVRADEPPVAELLDVDREYRDGAAAGRLPRIAPRRFNPAHEAWLPVLHARRGERQYTVLFSNTSRAHQLGTTRDWVVLYADGDDGERQYTVVTARSGPLEGRRVVRGRELECETFYARGREG